MSHGIAKDENDRPIPGRPRMHLPGEPAAFAVETSYCACGAELETLIELRDHVRGVER